MVMSKYQPLSDWLWTQDCAVMDLNFQQLEAVLRFTLPKSARTYREWWANSRSGHVQSRSWMDANWRVDSVDFQRQRVRFSKSCEGTRSAEVLKSPLQPHEREFLGSADSLTETDKVVGNLFANMKLSERAQKWIKAEGWTDIECRDQFELWIEHRAAVATRQAIMKKYASLNESIGSDSTLLIREDRDGR
jgi:hypothetical protein